MSEPLFKPPAMKQPAMSAEDYLAWHQEQDERYEYVDGAPRLKFATSEGAKLMVGATRAHMLIAGNVYAALREALRGKICQPLIADGKIVTPRGNYRYPDVSVDCGPYDPQALVLAEPVFVVEVWSKSTAWIDVGRKLGDYQSVASIRSILFLAQDAMRGQLWTRDAEWSVATFEGPDSIIAIPSLGLDVALATFYQGVGL